MLQEKPVNEAIQRIAFEMQEAGATKWQVMHVLKELEEFSGTEQQLRKRAYEVIEKLNQNAAKTFLSFERMRVFTSKEKREQFDRGNIIKSLLHETKVSRAVAEKIGSEVEDKIKDLKIEYLNTPLIREMVSYKLLEYGHEPIHREYTRLGMPVFEVKKKLEFGPFENKEILREYNWLAVITGKARELHYDDVIHVFSPEDFSTKIFCAQKFFEGTIEDIALQASALDKVATFPISLTALNYSIVTGKSYAKKEMLDSMEKIFRLTKRKRNAELALFTDSEWRSFGDFKKKAVHVTNTLLSTDSEAFEFYVSIDTKYQLKLLDKKNIRMAVLVNNLKERGFLYNQFMITGNHKGVLQLVGVNLEKILQQAGEEKEFFEKYREVLEAIEKLCEVKRQELSKRSYIEKWVSGETWPALALSGLLRATRNISQANQAKVAEQMINEASTRGFSVTSMPEKLSLEKFGNIEEEAETQKMLLLMSQKARKNYGFMYSASNTREAEALLSDVPCVKIRTL